MDDDELMMAFFVYESKIDEADKILDDICKRHPLGERLIYHLEQCEYIGRNGIHDAALRWLNEERGIKDG